MKKTPKFTQAQLNFLETELDLKPEGLSALDKDGWREVFDKCDDIAYTEELAAEAEGRPETERQRTAESITVLLEKSRCLPKRKPEVNELEALLFGNGNTADMFVL